MKALQVKV
jgi:hypothetical protein